MSIRCILLTGAAAALAGCVTPPGTAIDEARGQRYSYKETPQANGSYLLMVTYPRALDGENGAKAAWDNRAKTLCGDKPITKNIFRAERQAMLYSTYGAVPGGYLLEGYLTCGDGKPAGEKAG